MRPLSPDGRWRWDGSRWLPVARSRAATGASTTPAAVATPPPAPRIAAGREGFIPAPAAIDKPAWLDGEVDMPWMNRPLVAAAPASGQPLRSLRLNLAGVRPWPLMVGGLAVLALLLLALVVAAFVWQRLH